MLANGVSRDGLLLGKWAGATLTLGAPLLVSFAAGVILLTLVGHGSLEGPGLVRMAGIVGFALLYLSLFATVGLTVSALTGRSSSSLLICLTVWVGVTFVLPQVMASTGSLVTPVQTYQQVRLQRRAVDLDLARQVDGMTRQAKREG